MHRLNLQNAIYTILRQQQIKPKSISISESMVNSPYTNHNQCTTFYPKQNKPITTTQSLCPLPSIIWPSTSTLIVCTRGDILEFQVLLFQGLLHRELGLSLLSNALLFHVSFHAFMHCLGTVIPISIMLNVDSHVNPKQKRNKSILLSLVLVPSEQNRQSPQYRDR